MKKLGAVLAGCAALAGHWILAESAPRAADHADSPANAVAGAESSDIADLYAFTDSSATKVSLIMTFNRGAAPDEAFDTSVDYLFHLSSSNGAGGTAVSSTVTCNFAGGSPQQVTCVLEDGSTVIAQASGDVDTDLCSDGTSGGCNDALRVYAAVFDDPFFFNSAGFDAAIEVVNGVASGFEVSEHGCPEVDADTAADLRDCLASECDNFGGTSRKAVDSFAGQNVQGIVLELRRDAIDGGGKILEVWASTVVGNAQVDRAGRPAITTALLGTFATDSASADNLRDAYNANADRSAWDYRAEIEKSLPIFDALNSEAKP